MMYWLAFFMVGSTGKKKKSPVRLKIGCHGNRAEVLSAFRVEEDGVPVSKKRDGIVIQ